MATKNQGSAYLMILTVGITLGMAAFAAFTFSTSRNRHSEVAIQQRQQKSRAEGATEVAAKNLMDAIATYDYANVPSAGSPITYDVAIDGQAVSCTVSEAVVNQQTVTDAVGIRTILQQYSVVASTAAAAGPPERVSTVYEIMQTPLFQFAVFYGNNLEMLPGPSMTLSGRIHSNADMYLGTNGTFSIDSNYCRAAGSIYRHRMDGAQADMPGTVRAKDNTGAYVNWANGVDSEMGVPWYQTALDNWGDGTTANATVQNDVHGVTALSTPQVQNLQPGGFYHDEATSANGVVVEYTGGSPKILVDGVDVTVTANTIAGGAIVASGQMADNRERTNVYIPVYDVDMSRMKTFVEGYFGPGMAHPAKFSGLMYAYRTDTTATLPSGFRFKKAAMLPQPGASHANAQGGLTIVSPDPVYIWQDFNTGKPVPGTMPPPGVPANYDGSEDLSKKVPAAVIADAVNLLSNRWNNSKTPGGALPPASQTINTTYNAAIITGNVATPAPGDPAYSGGLENLPRFHENWTGKTAKFRGAFVNLFESQYADGAWVYGGNRYTAPTRDWNYDTAFNNANSLPPYTPVAVGVNRQVWTSSD